MKSTKAHYLWLLALNLLAIPVTLYLTYLHYKPELSDFCNFGEQWNCDIVNKSIYAELFGIPVSILGLITYILLLFFSIRGLKNDQSRFVPWVLAAVTGGVLFTLYLTGIEAMVLRTYCIFCVVQQVILLIQFGIFISLYRLTRKQ